MTFDLSLLGQILDLGSKNAAPIARTRREQSVGFFSQSSTMLSLERRGGSYHPPPPHLHVRVMKTGVHGRGLNGSKVFENDRPQRHPFAGRLCCEGVHRRSPPSAVPATLPPVETTCADEPGCRTGGAGHEAIIYDRASFPSGEGVGVWLWGGGGYGLRRRCDEVRPDFFTYHGAWVHELCVIRVELRIATSVIVR